VPCETVQATGGGDSADDGDGPGGSTEGGALVADQGSEFVATTGGGGSAGGGVGAGDKVGTAIGDGGSGGGAGDEVGAGGDMSPGTAVGDGGGGSGAGGKVGADGHSVGYGIVSEMTNTKSRVGNDGDGVVVETAAEGGGVDAGAAVGGVSGSETEHCCSVCQSTGSQAGSAVLTAAYGKVLA